MSGHVNGTGLIKGLAVTEIPCYLIEAAGAVVPAARDEHTGAHAGPVGNVVIFNRCVVHHSFSQTRFSLSLTATERIDFYSILQVQHPILDLLGTALVPELGADITAGAAGNIQLVLVTVAALGALPHQLAVILNDLDL